MALLSLSTPPTRRLSDALHSIQEDYNRVLAERDALRQELARIQNLGQFTAPTDDTTHPHCFLYFS